MPRHVTLLVGVLLAAVVALATALVVAERQGGPEPPGVLLDPDSAQRTRPSLTAEQRQQVADIALGDPRVQRLAQGQSVQVTEVVVWGMSSGKLLGGVATLALAEPATIEGEWLGMYYDGTEATSPPYTAVPYRAKLSNVTSLTVMVDLNTGQVVNVTPDHGARPEGTPELPPDFTPPPQGGD